MADLGAVVTVLTARDKNLRSALKTNMDRVKRFGVGVAKVGVAVSKAFFAMGAAAVAFGAKAVQAYAVQEEAEKSLQAALIQTGDDSVETRQKLFAYASALQKVTVYGDEGTLAVMAYGKNLGISTDKLEAATKAAMGLAARFRIDLKTAMMLVGRASQGQTQMLTRYGIILEETLSPQEKFNELLRIGAESFSLAEAQAKTSTGQYAQMKNALGDVAEQIGMTLIPGLTELGTFLNAEITHLGGLVTAARQSTEEIGALGKAIRERAMFWRLFQEYVEGTLSGEDPEVIKRGLRGIREEYIKLAEVESRGAGFGRMMDMLTERRRTAFSRTVQRVAEPIGQIGAGIGGAFQRIGAAAVTEGRIDETRKQTAVMEALLEVTKDGNDKLNEIKDSVSNGVPAVLAGS